jgi:hypothetical protein
MASVWNQMAATAERPNQSNPRAPECPHRWWRGADRRRSTQFLHSSGPARNARPMASVWNQMAATAERPNQSNPRVPECPHRWWRCADRRRSEKCLSVGASRRSTAPLLLGPGPEFPKVTAPRVAATQAPFCGHVVRSFALAGRQAVGQASCRNSCHARPT